MAKAENHSSFRSKRAAQEAALTAQQILREFQATSTEIRAEMASLSIKYETLQTSIVRTLTFLFKLLDDPEARAHAKAVVKDFEFNKTQPH